MEGTKILLKRSDSLADDGAQVIIISLKNPTDIPHDGVEGRWISQGTDIKVGDYSYRDPLIAGMYLNKSVNSDAIHHRHCKRDTSVAVEVCIRAFVIRMTAILNDGSLYFQRVCCKQKIRATLAGAHDS